MDDDGDFFDKVGTQRDLHRRHGPAPPRTINTPSPPRASRPCQTPSR